MKKSLTPETLSALGRNESQKWNYSLIERWVKYRIREEVGGTLAFGLLILIAVVAMIVIAMGTGDFASAMKMELNPRNRGAAPAWVWMIAFSVQIPIGWWLAFRAYKDVLKDGEIRKLLFEQSTEELKTVGIKRSINSGQWSITMAGENGDKPVQLSLLVLGRAKTKVLKERRSKKKEFEATIVKAPDDKPLAVIVDNEAFWVRG